MKLCECGCGLIAPIAKFTSHTRGYIKGKPLRFILGHHRGKQKKAFTDTQLALIDKHRHTVSIGDIASALGTCAATVSRAITSLPKKYEETLVSSYFANNPTIKHVSIGTILAQSTQDSDFTKSTKEHIGRILRRRGFSLKRVTVAGKRTHSFCAPEHKASKP